MTIDLLRKNLSNGVCLIFAKRLNATHHVRGVHMILFGTRKGFHVVEQSLNQLHSLLNNGTPVCLFQLSNGKILPVTRFGEESVSEIPLDEEEEILQKLPRFDFTVQVQVRQLLQKLGPH